MSAHTTPEMVGFVRIERRDGKATNASAVSRMLKRDHGVITSPGGWTVMGGWKGEAVRLTSMYPFSHATLDRKLRTIVEGINSGSSPYRATGY